MDSKSRTVTALRFHNRRDLRVEQVEPQKCGPNDVRLRIAYAGICGTDVGEYTNGPYFPPALGVTNPITGCSLPMTLGHEFVGTITELGSNVKNLSIGQRIAVNPACDHRHYAGLEPCNPCKQGRYNVCDETSTYGMAAHGGGFCDESVVHSMNCLPLPPNLSMKAAALLEPLTVAHHCVTDSGFQKGQAVLICGAGPIGLALLCILRVLGASKVIMTEVLEPRIKQAKELGADMVINPLAAAGPQNTGKDPTLAEIHKITGDGVDVSFDASGLQSTLDLAIAAVKPRGTIFNVAIHKKPLQINLNDLTTKEKKMTGGICYMDKDWEAVMGMMADGSLDAERLITSVVPLSRAIEDGFDELVNNPAGHVKILVQPDQGS